MSTRVGAKLLGLGIGVWLGILALGTVGGIFAVYYDNWFSSVTAEQRGQKNVREDTQANSAFRQGAYNSFFALCSTAQTTQEQIATLNEEKTTASADRKANLEISISALKMTLSEVVNQYNTDANKYTKGPFLDSSLPYPLNTKADIKCV